MRTQTAAPALQQHERRLVVIAAMTALLSMVSFQSAWAQATAPTLGTAKSFAVLAGSTVTNTGPSTIHGDLGVSPGSAVTGFPPGQVIAPGTIYAADAVALQAQDDVTTAYNALASQACLPAKNLTDQDLGGKTLVAGVYCFSSSAQLTGTLTLNAQGNPDAVFIFQIGSTLTTASNAVVRLTNGAQPCNVFWQVGSSATLGTYTSFTGNILALASITVTTGTSVNGRALARTAAVTLDNNNIFFSSCGPGNTTNPDNAPIIPGTGGGGTTPAPPVACVERTAPRVVWIRGGAKVTDAGGLASIVVDQVNTYNTNVTIPTFVPGATLVLVAAAPIDPLLDFGFSLVATDLCGNVTEWDPVEFTIAATETVTLDGVPRIEHFVTIENEGLQALIITVNGDARTVRLDRKATRTINIGGMMSPGDDNTITFEAFGFGTGQATITVRPK